VVEAKLVGSPHAYAHTHGDCLGAPTRRELRSIIFLKICEIFILWKYAGDPVEQFDS
jgi:hypothetical protein